MDNICHTLTGAAFGAAGLRRTTPWATATLMIASNLPDVDVLVFATDLPSVAFRRGWTHGVVAQAFLPVVLSGVIFVAGRGRGARFVPLLALSYLGVLAHVGMDWLNNYGVRLLMPFSGRWFYGDAAFIVDLWLWLMLGFAAWQGMAAAPIPAARRARFALLAAGLYVAALVVSARVARSAVIEQWRAEHGAPPAALMVGPVPITPFRRVVIVDAGDSYATGTFEWFPPRATFGSVIPKNDAHPAVRHAMAADPRTRAVLVWARFPYYTVESTASGDVVTVRDVRFGDRVGAARAVVAASRGSSSPTGRSR
jgi:inner membrane protein